MEAINIIIAIVLILVSLIIIAIILLQQGRQANLGAISGAVDSFMDKGKARTWDARLAKFTKVIAITFFVLVLLGAILSNLPQGETPAEGDTTATTTTVAGETTTAVAGETTTTAAQTTTTAATEPTTAE